MPKSRFFPILAASAIALAVLGASADARAELDGVMPIQPNPAAAAPRTLLNGALRVRTLTDAGNTTINEYATNTGQIVAYTWAGPTMPDLRALLGRHAGSYAAGAAAAALAAGGNLHASRVAQPDVIVESGGLMRSYVGRAWLPAALPPGVAANDLQ